jgi:HK97 family phage portal protein
MGFFSDRRTPERDRREPTFRNASPENPNTPLSNPDAWFYDTMTGGGDSFGPPVSEQTAMAQSAVYACVSLYAGLLAGTPLRIYRDMPDGGREEVKGSKLSMLLGEAPYPGRPLTSFMWREFWGLNVGLWGNHYSIIRYDNAARVIGFEPVMPWCVNITKQGYDRFYTCRLENNSIETVHHEDMIHIAGLGFDGVRGLSRIQAFSRGAVGLSKTLEQQIGLVHENSAKPSGIVTLSPGMSAEAKKRMVAFFNEKAAGRHNAGKILYLDSDAKYTTTQIPPEDLNTIEARRYQVQDICRFYKTPPVLIGEAGGMTAWGTGIEQLMQGFLTTGLEAEFQRCEHELNLKLLLGTSLYARFDRESLLSLDPLKLAQVMQTKINSFQLTPNEARRRANLPAMPGGDTLIGNGVTRTLEQTIQGAPAPAAPAEPAKEEPSK